MPCLVLYCVILAELSSPHASCYRLLPQPVLHLHGPERCSFTSSTQELSFNCCKNTEHSCNQCFPAQSGNRSLADDCKYCTCQGSTFLAQFSACSLPSDANMLCMMQVSLFRFVHCPGTSPGHRPGWFCNHHVQLQASRSIRQAPENDQPAGAV